MELKNILNEIYSILNILGDSYIEKLPKKLYQNIKKYKKDNNDIFYDINKPIKEQNISKETIDFFSYCYLMYWSEEKEEKNKLLKIYEQNEIKHNKKISKDSNIEFLNKNKKKI